LLLAWHDCRAFGPKLCPWQLSMSREAALAGGIAGGVESVVVQPLEMIKTRFQLSKAANPTMSQAFRQCYAEGGWPRFYRGLLPEMVGNVPTRTAMFAGKDFSSRLLEANGYQRSCAREGVAGFCSGLPEALVTTPFQVVKVRMQSKELVQFYRNDFDCLVKVLSDEGAMALFTGLSTTVIRNCVWNGIYFGAIAKLSDWSGPGPDGLAGEIQNLVTGLCAGILATLFDAPLDVVKSRIQESRPTTRRTLPATLLELSREGGIPALYKGFVPKAWRMGIGGAVGFVTFEFVHRALTRARPA